MQSLQRMEDKFKAVTKENIEMVGTEEQNEDYCMIYVCYGGHICIVYACIHIEKMCCISCGILLMRYRHA